MRVVPAVTGDAPKYVGDVWVVEVVDRLGRQDNNLVLGVLDTLAGARKFSSAIAPDPNYSIVVSKTAYYTTNWSDTNEE